MFANIVDGGLLLRPCGKTERVGRRPRDRKKRAVDISFLKKKKNPRNLENPLSPVDNTIVLLSYNSSSAYNCSSRITDINII